MVVRRVLVTGATGFVGRQICKSLAQHDVRLRCVVRDGKGHMLSDLPDVEIVCTKDLFSEKIDWWKVQLRAVDTVIHAAWYVEPGKYLESDLNFKCLWGSVTLAQAAIDTGVRRFVGIGSCFEYDLNEGVLSTQTRLKPTTPYAIAKVALYLALRQRLKTQSVEFAWCRLFYLFGEGEDKRRFVPYIRSKLEKNEPAELTTGSQVRDFLDVAEAGAMIASVALSDQKGDVNICSGIPITIRALAERIADEYGRRDLLQFGARSNNLTDPPCVIGIPNR